MSSKLDRIRIATPCPVTWEQMVGDDRVRFCEHCELNVYNLASLSRREAEALLSSTEGRLCARLYRRHDGTVLTEDCPVGLSRLRRRVAQTAAAVFALVGSLNMVAFGQKGSRKESCKPQIRITQKDIASSVEETVVAGQVTDPQSAVVPGTVVTMINAATNNTETTRTNDEGRFQFIGLLPGKYSVKVQHSGFMKLTVIDLQIKKNQATNIDVSLIPSSDEVLVGVVGYSEENDPPGTATITQKIINSLPH
jgi:Carboxypeptidase regulatory-like domain